MVFKKVDPKVNFPKIEEDILDFWGKKKIFEKSVEGRSKDNEFTFYDGPPFATGLPHYGNFLPGLIKDVIPRYKTMQGYRIERIWGWDCHGLPIENIVEKELGFKTKKQIENYGVDKFNEKCRSKVLTYAAEWQKVVGRIGRWVDMENAYLTMNLSYMESIWWVFKSLWDKKLIYEGYKVMPFCPRCSTPLSNFEIGQGYKDKKDQTVTIKFEVKDEPNTYLLAWTTTPWTLPGNLALAVGENIDYVIVQKGKEKYILAKDRLDAYLDELVDVKILSRLKGKDLVGKKYKPLFSFHKKPKKAFEIIVGDFISTEDGTGIVHIAPAFGEDDYIVSKENGIDFFMPVDEFGRFTKEASSYVDLSVIETETNEKIIKDLKKQGRVIKSEEIIHSYPHCYRCETPLIYRAVSSFFVDVQTKKKRLLELNKDIYWMPDFVGKGRFYKILEGAPDWNISRNRFWGTPLPVWRCEKCEKIQVFGSVKELEKASNKKIEDLHLHKIQNIKISCGCGGRAKLSGEVLDCWFESGSMPYAQDHYPFENKNHFEKNFPADFIAEGIDQTRGWFNSLLILSCNLFDKTSFKNVIVNGIVLAEDGQKMAKRLRNYPDPMDIVHHYGADAMRFYLMNSPAVKAEDLCFSEKGVDEVVKKLLLTLWNTYSFFITYASFSDFIPQSKKVNSKNILDQWIISEKEQLILSVTERLDKYDIFGASKLLQDFIDNLSNWYIRRSRNRFKSEKEKERNETLQTLYEVLVDYIKLLAPCIPFITEEIYQNLVRNIDSKAPESVHLCDWPKADKKLVNKKLNEDMQLVRKTAELGLKIRVDKGIKIRQPLSKVGVFWRGLPIVDKDIVQLILDELNVREYNPDFEGMTKKHPFEMGKTLGLEVQVSLNTEITQKLREEGLIRDLIRHIQSLRKQAQFEVSDKINLYYQTKNKELQKILNNSQLLKETLTKKVVQNKSEKAFGKDIKINNEEIWIGVERVE